MPTPSVIIPLWPRPGSSETLEWLTYVMDSEDGTEERTEMRSSPRQGFRYSYFESALRQAGVNNVLYGGRTQQWWVPAWSQVQAVGPVPAFQAFVDCDTRYSEYRVDGYALLWESPDHYSVIQTSAISDTQLTIPAPGSVGPTAFTDAYIMPLRTGYLTSNPSRSLDGKSSILTLAFAVEDNAELTVAAPTQYLGDDLYTDAGILDGGQTPEQLDARFDLFDPGLGIVSYRAPWTYIRPQRVHRMVADGAVEHWSIREFLHRRKGRSAQFWQPSFENDLRLNQTGALTTSIDVYPDDYDTYATDRSHIAVETLDGTWYPRAITGTTSVDSEHLTLDLDSSLGGFDASTVRRISFLGLRRLDTDRAEIAHVGATVFSCPVNTVEIQP